MKTTVEIPDKILGKARQFAGQRNLTLREVLIAALQLLLDQASGARSYQLPDRSVAGEGLSPEFDGAGWSALRDAAYGMEPK